MGMGAQPPSIDHLQRCHRSCIFPRPVEYLRYSQFGVQFFVTIAICGGAGFWLDRRFGTMPVLTSVLGFAGFAIALYHLVREVYPAEKKGARKS